MARPQDGRSKIRVLDRARDLSVLKNVQTVPRARTVTYTGREVKLTTHCLSKTTVKNGRVYTSSAVQVFREWTEETLSFTLDTEFHSQRTIKAKSADTNSVMPLSN
jgi:hypothetical protein